MRLQFLGAATTVTGSQFLLTTDRARVLVDCGMFQGSPHEAEHNREPFPYDPATLDALLLTHAHLDHCGLIPLLAKHGFRGPIHTTRATAELARLVLLDSGKLQEEQAEERKEHAERLARREARRAAGSAGQPDRGRSDRSTAASAGGTGDREAHLREQPPHVMTTIATPLYTEADAERSLALFRGLEYDQPFDVAAGIRATFRDAGHILGSAIIELDAAEGDGRSRRIVFSGDLGRPNAPIIRDPMPVDDGADYVLVESTYGGREHDPADEATRILAETVRLVAEHSGVLLIPAFAIGRTQEVVWTLHRLLDAGSIPHLPLYLDSPMASHASDIYRAFPGYYDNETEELLKHGEQPLDYPGQVVTRTAGESKAIARAPRPMMIVASNGMLTGGRVVHHLRNLVGDPSAVLLFVGYKGEGTLGDHLQKGAREIRVDGAWLPVRCQIRTISGFSAHADESELVDWLSHFTRGQRRPRRVFIVHGDPDGELAVERRVTELGLQPHRPAWREVVELD
jgi:metallo-beta-lactamase family protein